MDVTQEAPARPGGLIARLRARLPEPILMPNGKRARLRLLQTLTGSGVIAVCAAALVAGVYFNVLQVRWGPVDLKPWWDGLVHAASWPLYRHGYRDLGEPEVAYLIVGTLLAKRRTWTRRASWKRMVIAPAGLLALSFAGITGAVWLLNFGLPRLLGVDALPDYWLTAGTISAGFIIGHIARPLWTPVGATINGWFVDWSVDRWEARHWNDPWAKPPAWVRHWYLAPLPLRERWQWQRLHNEAVTTRREPSRWLLLLSTLPGLLIAYLVITGLIAHFWIGSGHPFPFLAP